MSGEMNTKNYAILLIAVILLILSTSCKKEEKVSKNKPFGAYVRIGDYFKNEGKLPMKLKVEHEEQTKSSKYMMYTWYTLYSAHYNDTVFYFLVKDSVVSAIWKKKIIK